MCVRVHRCDRSARRGEICSGNHREPLGLHTAASNLCRKCLTLFRRRFQAQSKTLGHRPANDATKCRPRARQPRRDANNSATPNTRTKRIRRHRKQVWGTPFPVQRAPPRATNKSTPNLKYVGIQEWALHRTWS